MSLHSETQIRRELVRYSLAMHAAGFVANHDGNLSARVGENRIICTPTAFSKSAVSLEDLVVVDAAGAHVSGRQRPFSELVLHRAVYAARPEVNAVVHAHCPFATAFGAAGTPLPHPFLPEAVVSLGAEIPTVPLTAPGAASAKALESFVKRCDAVLIAGNGVLAWGPSLEVAWLRLELVEHLARIAHAALPLGGVKRLPADMVTALLASRAKAGLKAPEEAGPTPAADPVVQRAAAQAVAVLPNADRSVAERIAAEVAKALGR
jgi:L-fuculose-phosphate aldolase